MKDFLWFGRICWILVYLPVIIFAIVFAVFLDLSFEE